MLRKDLTLDRCWAVNCFVVCGEMPSTPRSLDGHLAMEREWAMRPLSVPSFRIFQRFLAVQILLRFLAVQILLVLFATATGLWGQTTVGTGSIVGTVTDQSGAVLSGAEVTIKNSG